MGTFGEKLRKQREQRGLPLDAISNTTKISTRMLRALEEEKFDQLPGGVFNKGFVRAYARQVGLDEEEAISDYLAALRENQVQSQNILPDFRAVKLAANSTPPPVPVPRLDNRNVAQPGNHGPEALSASDEEDLLAAERRKLERRNDERRHREDRRQENRKSDGVKGRDKDKDKDKDEVEDNAWRVEDRNAADLLSQADRDGVGNSRDQHSSPLPMFTTGSYGESNNSSQIPWGKLVAALVLVFIILAFWNLHRRNRALIVASAHPPTSALPESAPSPAPDSAQSSTTAVAFTGSRASASITSSKSSPAIQGANKPSEKMLSAAAQPVMAHNASGSASNQTAVQSPSRSEVSTVANPAAPKSISHPANPKPQAMFTLLVRAEKTSWVSITADGNLVAQETLIAPAETSVRASNEILVRAGNAAGVSFILNGKEIPAQGSDGEVRTYSFNSSGLQVSSAQAPLSAH